MNRIFIILLVFLTLPLCSQEFHWVTRFGGLDRDQISSTVIDSSENSYHVGYFRGNLNFDDSPTVLNSMGKYDIFFTKFDLNGNLVWAKHIFSAQDEFVHEMLLLEDQTILMYGRFKGVLDLDLEASEHLITSAGNGFNTFLVNYDRDGHFIWAKQFTGEGNNTPADIKLDSDGSIFVSGRFDGNVDFDPDPDVSVIRNSDGNLNSYLIKLNSSGSYSWGKHFTGNENVFTQDFVIYQNDIYCIGYFQENMTIAPEYPTIRNSMGLSDFFISKFNTEGKLDTLITYGSVRDDHFSDLVVNHNGIFISGTFLSEVDIDPDQVNEKVLVSNGGQDVFVLALDFAFNFIWARQFGGSDYDNTGRIEMNLDDELIYSFSYTGSMSLEISGETHDLIAEGDPDDAFLTINSNDGSVSLIYELKGTGSQSPFMTGLENGLFMISGSFEGSTDFDNTPSNDHIIASHGVSDCFIMLVDLRITSAVHDLLGTQLIQISPNPVSSGGTINFNSEGFNGMVHIVDTFGRIISSVNCSSTQLNIPSHLLPNTYYALFINDNGTRSACRFVVR